jgi:ribosomal protein S18 acetylase RimI-like enzyme
VVVEVRPMTDEEFAEWLPTMRDRYAEDIRENAGASADKALAKAEADIERLFPGGKRSEQQLVHVIEAEGRNAGVLWFTEREDELTGRGLWIYEIRVDEAFRRRGLGREAMQFVEEEARRRGLSGVTLNVFGGNVAARSLYQSLGYEEVAVFMRKPLAS